MAMCDAMFFLLQEAFIAFSEATTNEGSCWEACKTSIQQLQDQWNQKGLSGANALNIITQYQAQIKWQDMSPDQFSRFYRFIFHIFRESGKRNIQMTVAVAAWRLVLPGRFRLLDRWCAFAASSSAAVVTQDLWRQVLDFSRTVHEDLSNFDSAGSWAVLLDDFVEFMRTLRCRSYNAPDGLGGGLGGGGGSSDRLLRNASLGPDLAVLYGGCSGGSDGAGGSGSSNDGDAGGLLCTSAFLGSIPPRCGSKRRGPDVDVVTEQLSAMPLGAGQHHLQQHQHSAGTIVDHSSTGLPPMRSHSGLIHDPLAKRLCLDRPIQLLQQPAPAPHAFASTLGRGGAMGGGGGGAGGRTPSSCQPMSCSTGSVDSDGSQGGPVGSTAAMDCWLQDPTAAALQEQLQQQLCQQTQFSQQQQQQRKAVRARRSGLSDIVKSAVTDALGF